MTLPAVKPITITAASVSGSRLWVAACKIPYEDDNDTGALFRVRPQVLKLR